MAAVGHPVGVHVAVAVICPGVRLSPYPRLLSEDAFSVNPAAQKYPFVSVSQRTLAVPSLAELPTRTPFTVSRTAEVPTRTRNMVSRRARVIPSRRSLFRGVRKCQRGLRSRFRGVRGSFRVLGGTFAPCATAAEGSSGLIL